MKTDSQKYAIKIRKKLLKNMTYPERLFEEKLKCLGVRYVLQKVVFVDEWQFYVIDFYFPKVKIGIELDGKHHDKQVKKDNRRTKRLLTRINKIVRIPNKRALAMKHKELVALLKLHGIV